MRSLASVLCLSGVLAGFAACGNENDPSVSGVYPTAGFIGRKLRVEVSGDATHWDEKTTVDFGPGITVDSVALGSETAIFADITIDDTITPGLHDVVVKGGGDITLKGAFAVESPISLDYVGTIAQGSYVTFTIVNHDFDTPFDTTTTGDGFFTPLEYTNLFFTPPPGVRMVVNSADAYTISGAMFLDIDAAPGPVVLESGPAGGRVTTFASGESVDVAARTAAQLTSGTRVDGTIDTPLASHLYTFSTTQDPGLALLKTTADDPDAGIGVIVLGDSGSFDELIDYGPSVAVVAAMPEKVYAIVIDLDGVDGYGFSLMPTSMALTTAPEAASNDTANAAQALTLPAEVESAAFSSGTDVDWYKLTTGAGDAGKHIHVITTAGDPYCDPVIELFDGANGGTSWDGPSDDADYHENFLSSATVAASTTYWVKVTWSTATTWSQSNDSYNAIVFLE